MGDYYTLRFQVPLNDYGKLLVSRLGTSWADLVPEFPEVESYSKLERAEFIPHGGVCYGPDGWNNMKDVVDGVWRVCCSIKSATVMRPSRPSC